MMQYTILTFTAPCCAVIALQAGGFCRHRFAALTVCGLLPDRPDERRAVETPPTTTVRGSFAIRSVLEGTV